MGVAYNTIREWNFEEWWYMGGIVIEKVLANEATGVGWPRLIFLLYRRRC